MASGCNLWVWLECIGVVSGCCCKEVYRVRRLHTCASPETSTCEVPRDISRKLQVTSCAIMAS